MKNLLSRAPRFLFFTGKGGVGKTSIASSTAVGLAESGKRVLLISTDPASNLDEVFGQSFKSVPTPVKGIKMLDTMNINPMHAVLEYREKMVDPYRGVLPQKAVAQMKEGVSCPPESATRLREF